MRSYRGRQGLVLALIFPAVLSSQTVVGSITRPGLYPTAVAVYETGNKVFVADQTTANVYMYDGATFAELNSVNAGILVYRMVVHEPTGKLYALSGNSGVITVINAATGALTGTHTGYLGGSTDIQLDAGAGKLYAISLSTGLRQIDVATEAETNVPGLDLSGFCALGVNPVTHEVFVSASISGVLNIVNGATLAVTKVAFMGGYGIGVNWLDNKVYSAWPGNSIYNRNTGEVTRIGIGSNQNDAEAMTFNPVSDRMYTNSEVDSYTTIIDGVTGSTWNLPLGDTTAAPVVMLNTNHVYFAGMDRTVAVEDSTQLSKLLSVTNPPHGGLLIQGIAANQTTGRVYAINDQSLGYVGVIQDAASNCVSSIAPDNGFFAMFSGPQYVMVTITPGCSWGVAQSQPDSSDSSDTGTFLFEIGTHDMHTGAGSVGIAAWDNTGATSRTSTLLIAGKLFTGTQDPNSCAYSISRTNEPFGANGGNGSFDLTVSPSPCSWTNLINVDWITTQYAFGSGSVTVPYTVAPNPNSAARTGTITMVGFGELVQLTLTVTEAGTATTGTIQVNATLNGSPWSGGVNYPLSGPSAQGGVSVPSTYSNETAGSYTLSYSSGGPPGASFVSITPSATQTLNASQTITFTINFAPVTSTRLQFVLVTPCRVVDTRNANGPLGGPGLFGNSRDFPIPTSPCGIPADATAYSLNVTVVPDGPLGYLTIWPTGQSQPVVSTLNSKNGIVKADAAIVPAGTNGSVSVYGSAATHVVLDINGYFIAGNPASLAFYPVTPCRVVDTRNAPGPLGGPIMTAGQTRAFPLRDGCSIPSSAEAYALNFTVVPGGTPLGYLTTWPDGEPQPVVSTLNAPTGLTTANAAIVPAGSAGEIDVYTSAQTHVVIDINGYFAPPDVGGLSFYVTYPCRAVDTRNATGPLGGPAFLGQRDFPLSSSGCGLPTNAQAYSLNATVVPPAALGYLTLWPTGETQPVVSTLNSPDGATDSNAAIVPTLDGSISAYASAETNLILDVNGYFAP